MNTEEHAVRNDDIRDEVKAGAEHPGNAASHDRPEVESYDPHFGSHLMKEDSFWRL
jgi:hypothetical protein